MLNNKSFISCVLLCLLPMICNAAGTVLLDEIIIRGTSVPSNEENLTIREVRESRPGISVKPFRTFQVSQLYAKGQLLTISCCVVCREIISTS